MFWANLTTIPFQKLF